ncbi:Erv1/Alr family sulfhydryl oxidase [uncultured virus]|nr:Erv1/Alr family sulfhydryl oxidase [uncultured virus]
MSKTDENNSNNGMMTKIWGPGLWVGLHCISFGYPLQPTEDEKKKYKEFFTLIGDVLPCSYCRDSYRKFLTDGNTKLTDEIMQNRNSLTKWLYFLHEEVNKKLGINYGISYDDVVIRYESFRASCAIEKNIKGCVVPIDKKSLSFKNLDIKECPIIPLELAKYFIEYAKLRGFQEQDFYYFDNPDINKYKRNKECNEIISSMRQKGITSLEESGQFQGLPTIDELKLILKLSSNLSLDTLNNLIKKIPSETKNKQKFYKLIS